MTDRRQDIAVASMLLCAISFTIGCGAKPAVLPAVAKAEPGDIKVAPKRAAKPKPIELPATSDIFDGRGAKANSPSSVDAEPQQVFRPNDARLPHDDQRLAEVGIRCFESKRLKLYTDIDPQIAATLPTVIDRAYEALEKYFGALPPDRARTEFQMTGYLIGDDALFREAGLIPGDLPRFEHGRHRRNEFWMREQQYDYYRRHLLIHEATHCFMTTMPDVDAPVWYMEGMAECFGTHRIAQDGTIEFRVMPISPEEFAGSGRITVIRNDYASGEAKSVTEILGLRPEEFLKTDQYAWSWGLCTFLDTHPRYQERFRKLGEHLQQNAFPAEFHRSFSPDARDLATEWTLFAQNLQYGYDATRAAIDFQPGAELTASHLQSEVEIKADRGWQSSTVRMREGDKYMISATGRFELAQEPKPWISEPSGISFRYFGGKPLGLLLGCLRTESGESGGGEDSMLRVYPIGLGGTFTAPVSGTMYLRINDEWNSLSDNKGSVRVEVRAVAP
ncbi:MAG TPA: hypothetical protein VGM98_14315 [Schlesneria sp.]|jgi:hypothetical protein